jgi:hypothetical protein
LVLDLRLLVQLTAGIHLNVEESNHGDRMVVGPIVEDVLLDGTSVHPDRQVISRFTKVRESGQLLHRGVQAIGVLLPLNRSPRFAGVTQNRPEIRACVSGEIEPEAGRHL